VRGRDGAEARIEARIFGGAGGWALRSAGGGRSVPGARNGAVERRWRGRLDARRISSNFAGA
jgi:hypothetical protein